MEPLHIGYAAAGALAVALILASGRMRRMPLTEPLAGLLLGVVLGPAVAGVLTIPEDAQTGLLLEVSRALLAVSLVGVGLRFPIRSLRSVVRPVAVLVGVVMLLSAAITSGLAATLLGMPVALAILLGACLSPTDPVLASGVVTGAPAAELLPTDLRKILTEESGINDGLALPLVLVALAPVLGEGIGGAVGDGARQVLLALLLAVPIGYAVGRIVRVLEADDEVEGPPELMLTLVLSVAVLGIARLVDSDGVLAVFVAALAYNAAVGERELERQDEIDEAFNRILVVPVFMLLGVVLPWSDWAELGWSGVAFVGAVLLLRRPPVVLLLRRALGLRPRDAVFAGWFGPIGVSALFYLVHSEHEGVTDPRLFAAGTLVIAASTLLHGVTTLPGRRLYARTAQRGEVAIPTRGGGGDAPVAGG